VTVATAVYVLCLFTSVVIALLLMRGFARSRTRLLLWSGLCFAGLAVNNLLLVLDHVVFDGEPLRTARDLVALAAPLVLLAGVIWDRDPT
jgi:hypothetical protein